MKKIDESEAAVLLRQKAIELLKKKSTKTLSGFSEADIMKFIHELEVHQIELELQNEELLAAKESAETASEKYTELYDFAPSGYFTLSREGEILKLNISGAKMLGRERAGLYKSKFGFFVAEESKPTFNTFFNDLFNKNSKEFCEIILEKGDNLQKNIFIEGVVNKNGEQCILTAVDVTLSRLAEEKVRMMEKDYLKLFIDHSAVKFIVDPDTGSIFAANNAAAKFYGWSCENLRKMKMQEINTLPFGEIRDEMSKVGKNEKDKFQFKHRIADGTVRDVEVFSSSISIAGKNYFHSIIVDITERKQAEELLRQSELRFRTITSSANYPIITVTLEGIIKDWNNGAEKIFGYTENEAIGRNITILIPQKYVKKHINGMNRIAKDGNIHVLGKTVELSGIHKNGNEFPIELSLSEWETSEGKFFTGIIHDITERKHVESYIEMNIEVLRILNESGSLEETIQSVVSALKTRTGFDAIGIRLKDGDDFPYIVQEGFSKKFLLTENTLIDRNAEGGLCRDINGDIRLECTCGLVISGKTDPSNPLFTIGGSSWTNDSVPFLDLPLDQDPRYHPRNRCIHEGYASIALIPIRMKDQIIGMIQFNDRRKGCFSLSTVEQLEGIAAHLGGALMRKQVEDALVESELRYHDLFHKANEGLLIMTADGKIDEINESFAEMHGYTLDEFKEKDIRNLNVLKEKTMQGHTNTIERMNAGEVMRFEVEHYHKDGHIISFNVTASSIQIGQQQLYMNFFQDITDRKKTEDKLRKSELRYHDLFHKANEGLLIMTVDGKIYEMNESFAEMHGYKLEELKEKDIRDLDVLKEMTMERNAPSIERMNAGEVMRFEVEHYHKDGHILSFSVTASLIQIGEQPLFMAFHQDISERKKSEKLIEQQNAQLQELNQMKDKLFAIIAHDLRGPFTGLLGLTELMTINSSKYSQQEISEYTGMMRTSVLNIFKLLENLLEWARLQIKSISYTPKEINLLDTILGSVESIKQNALLKNILIINEIPESLKIFADETMCTSLMRNIISNAVKFTMRGGKVIVRAEEVLAGLIEISVSDTGIGMSEDTIYKLFKPGEKVGMRGTEGEASTGLGLLLCKEFVEKHGGHIWVESNKDVGSTFYFTLPSKEKKKTKKD